MDRPIGDSLGQKRRAAVAFTSTTLREPRRSASVKSRPDTSGTRSVWNHSGSPSECRRGAPCPATAAAGRGRPSTSYCSRPLSGGQSPSADARDARQRAQSADERLIKAGKGVARPSLGRRVEPQREDPRWIEPGVDGDEMSEASHHQPEPARRTSARASSTTTSALRRRQAAEERGARRRLGCTLLERGRERGARCLERGHEPEEEPGDDGRE